jgi:hypothetical protein
MSRVSSKLRFVELQLPTLTEQPPAGSDWIHEVKHDGYRTLLLVERETASAYTLTALTGATATPALLRPPRACPAGRRFSMARSSYRTSVGYQTSRPCNWRSDFGLSALSSMLSISFISTVRIFATARFWNAGRSSELCSAKIRQVRCNIARSLPATPRPFSKSAPGMSLKASSRSVPPHPIGAAAQRHGSRPNVSQRASSFFWGLIATVRRAPFARSSARSNGADSSTPALHSSR